MKLIGAAQTDIGRVRHENQDSYGFDAAHGLYLVADGMGGHVGGKRASEEATRAVTAAIGAPADGSDGAARLRLAIEDANGRIWQLAQQEPALHGMGTTIVALLLDGDRIHIGHVGDSRLYRIRDDAIAPMTQDHSYLAELSARGIEPDTQMRARYGSVLTRALGADATVEADVATEPLRLGDTFVLCSDGVYRGVGPDDVLAIVRSLGDDLRAMCTTIVTRANAAGGADNSTVIVLRAVADDVAEGTAPHCELPSPDGLDEATTEVIPPKRDGSDDPTQGGA